MIWQDILIERSVSDDELSAALSEAFAVREAAIALIDPEETFNADQIAIIGERWRVEGDFAVHMHVILRTEDVISTTKEVDDVTIVGWIAQALKTACFIGDDDINPFTGFMVRGPGDARPAKLDPQAEDEGIYRLTPVAARVG